MPTDLIGNQLVVWKPNVDQVTTLDNQTYAYLITVLDADYPAITTTKNLRASVSGYSASGCSIGVGKVLSSSVAGLSTASVTKLSTGKELIDASVRGLSSAIRCSIFSEGLQFSTTPVGATYGQTLNATPPVSNLIEYTTDGNYAVVCHSGATSLYLYNVFSGSATLTAVPFTQGQVVGATTIAAGELNEPGANTGDFYPYWHLRRNPSDDNVHFVWRPYNSNKMYYYSQQWGTFYLNSHTSFAPNTSTSAYSPIAVYPETDSLAHIFYLTQFNAGGKTYVTPAMMTYNGTTWSSVRFGGSGWNSNGYTVTRFQLYRADANDPQKLYMTAITSAGGFFLVWIDLNLRTASTTPISTLTGRTITQFSIAEGSRIPAVDESVIHTGLIGDLNIRIGQSSSITSFWFEENARLTYTIAGWKTPSVNYGTISSGNLSANSLHFAGGYMVVSGQLYHMTYYMSQVGSSSSRYLKANYRSVTDTVSGSWSTPVDVSIGGAPTLVNFGSTNAGYYIRSNENRSASSYSHLIATSDYNGDLCRFYRVTWASSPLTMHLIATLEDVTSSFMSLNVITTAQNIELAGLLTGVSAATADVLIGDKQELAGSAAALSSAVVVLQSTNANIDASVFCVSSASVSMRVGKILLEALAESRTNHQATLQVLHDALLDGTLVSQSTATLTAISNIQLTFAAAVVSFGTAVLDVQLTLAGTASGVSSATAQLFLERFLSALLLGNSTATLNLNRAVDLENGVSVLVKNAPVNVRTPKP